MVRLDGIDRLRGLAILLMVLDHVLVFSGSENHVLRHTITRAALPLFCLVAGVLCSKVNRGRLLDLVWIGCWSSVLNIVAGQPDVTLLFALGFALYSYWSSPVFLAICILQPVTWPLPWSGYQPGTVLALLAVGRGLVAVGYLNRLGAMLPQFFRLFGQWPLAIYGGHLTILAIWRYCQP